MLTKLGPGVQRALAVTIAVFGLLCSTLLLVPRTIRIWQAKRQVADYRKAINASKQQKALEIAALRTPQWVALPESKDEQLLFLKELGRIVAASRVQLVSYRPPAATERKPAEEWGPGKARILPRPTAVTVSGSYGELMMLFNALQEGRRFFAVENLRIRTETYPRLSAAFRLVRYVAPESVPIVEHKGGPS